MKLSLTELTEHGHSCPNECEARIGVWRKQECGEISILRR